MKKLIYICLSFLLLFQFALCESYEIAKKISGYSKDYYSSIKLECDTYISNINKVGPIVVSEK